ncbi:MAG: prolyl oligopeptidase family serine peptidase [Deltaproteobacteria bacterium]|nr:prolyl oligopeptidase family serine peptidase [Deltaproteobacteria bacterium]
MKEAQIVGKIVVIDSDECTGCEALPPHIGEIRQNLKLPMVVMPHGGPAYRDYLAFDHFVQFLSNRGYAVHQINYRGSSGYGKAFEVAGYGEWGGKMQDDVTDGIQIYGRQGGCRS